LALLVVPLAAGCSGGADEPAAVGGCMRPTADDGGDASDGAGYVAVGCDEAEASHEVVALEDAEPTRVGPACPAGTDVALQQSDGGSGWQDLCLRSLGDDHPGDTGRGGGELTAGDCVGGPDDAVAEVPCPDAAVDGPAGAAAGEPPRFRVVAITDAAQDCPPETTAPLERSGGGTLCAVPA
jgi:hypothetical protein